MKVRRSFGGGSAELYKKHTILAMNDSSCTGMETLYCASKIFGAQFFRRARKSITLSAHFVLSEIK